MDFWYSVFKGSLRVIQAISFKRILVSGNELAPEGPKIVVGNHPNTTDSAVILKIFSDRFHYIVYADTFDVPLWGRLLKLAKQIPIRPTKGRQALDTAKEKLAQGHSVVIFPEGQMTGKGEQRIIGNGAMRLSLETGIPLVPLGFFVPPDSVHTFGSKYFGSPQKKGRYPIRSSCYVQIGHAWSPRKELRAPLTSKTIRHLTKELMQRINTLSALAEASST